MNVASWALRVSMSSSAGASSSRWAMSTPAVSGGVFDDLPRRVRRPRPAHARPLGTLTGEHERGHSSGDLLITELGGELEDFDLRGRQYVTGMIPSPARMAEQADRDGLKHRSEPSRPALPNRKKACPEGVWSRTRGIDFGLPGCSCSPRCSPRVASRRSALVTPGEVVSPPKNHGSPLPLRMTRRPRRRRAKLTR